jgi:lipopolysaccharide transport system ATP-binding protein
MSCSSVLLSIHDLQKSFRLYPSPVHRLKEALFNVDSCVHHHALQAINLQVCAGESVAIIGRNGAGKSTLLKLMTGVLLPDSGEIIVNGRITGLLELGTGFDGELSGRDNIWINGLLIGMTREEIEEQYHHIIQFAELGYYIDAPVKSYSSGMVMRLGFSIAIHANPACFIVDEALAVGDARFQQKCLQKIKQFRQQGGALLFVSHDLSAIKQMCERTLVLHQGRVDFDGETLLAVNRYNQLLADLDAELLATQHEQGYGHQQIRIVDIQMLGASGQTSDFATGETVNIVLTIEAEAVIQDMSIGFMIRDRFGNDVFGTNSYLMGMQVSQDKGTKQTYQFQLSLNLGHGKYSLTLAVHSGSHHHDNCQHWLDDIYVFQVTSNLNHGFSGSCFLPTQFQIVKTEEAVG